MKNNLKKGRLIWITGLAGSGKTSIATKLKKKINNNNLFLINGDELRSIFQLKRYDRASRLKYAYTYSKLCKKITDQGIDVIIAAVAMFHEIRAWNRLNVDRYHEIYIKTPISLLKKKNKKKLYIGKKINVFGKDIKAEYPKKPDQIVINNYKNDLNKIVDKLLVKINQFNKN